MLITMPKGVITSTPLQELFSPPAWSSQQLEMPRHLVDFTLRRGPNAEHRRGAAGNLRAAGIVNNLRAYTQAEGLGLQDEQVVFATVDLQCDLGLP